MDSYSHKEACKAEENRERKGKIFIYPYGDLGRKIYDMLKNQCGIENVTAVDNKASIENEEILSASDLSEMEWENGKGFVLVASNNQRYYTELRSELRRYVRDEYIGDFYGDGRFGSLVLASREIHRDKIPGNIAEAGVYKGDFAKWMNVLFPDRKLYLFDSFEGFQEGQVAGHRDNVAQTDEWIHMLKDTSVDLVMGKMAYRGQVIVKKGFVPDTFEGVEDTFAFVNLDMDIYQPTYDALMFFWPRLSAGGYIFVHDYGIYDGIGEAVKQFCMENHTGYVCLPDRTSVAIAKPLG
ncbi:TylF/MycF/NovP-related O-methyltransferase [Otoolea muris]|uniref:TylF/MycF/NovP-related O-methyltransferase n=1 Tax=Otoolea muris TaxID=2941515 RepID=UPI00203BB188|nr:TylF/MycF/NovP-related O-methyltransferase [Otoolea muris]